MMHAFSKAAARYAEEMGIGLVEAILRERADLQEGVAKGTLKVAFAEVGKNAHTVFIGDEVFKGPHLNRNMLNPTSVDAYAKIKATRLSDFENEIDALKILEGSGLPVPRLTCVGNEALFYGMTRMPGVMLVDVMETFTPQQSEALGYALAHFNIRLAKTLPMKEGKYAKHADLHKYNILVDEQTHRLTGIIDFGKIMYHGLDKLASSALDPEFDNALQQEFDRRKSEFPTAPDRRMRAP